MKRNPSGTAARRTCAGCQAASAMSSSPSAPSDVVPRGRHVAPSRGLHEIQRVGQPEAANPHSQRDPGAVHPPAGRGQRAHEDADQHEIGQRVGERGGDRQRLALGRVERRLEDDRRAHRGDRQRRDRPVSPQGLRHIARARAQQQHHADQRQDREKQEARVGERRDRRRLDVVEDDRVVKIAERPGLDTPTPINSQATRSRPVARIAPAETQQPGHDLDDVMRIVARDRTEPQPGPEHDLQLEDGHPRAEHGESDHHCAAGNAILRDAVLDYADFADAQLGKAVLTGASLSHARNLTQEQIDETIGDASTTLPAHLQMPAEWLDVAPEVPSSRPIPLRPLIAGVSACVVAGILLLGVARDEQPLEPTAIATKPHQLDQLPARPSLEVRDGFTATSNAEHVAVSDPQPNETGASVAVSPQGTKAIVGRSASLDETLISPSVFGLRALWVGTSIRLSQPRRSSSNHPFLQLRLRVSPSGGPQSMQVLLQRYATRRPMRVELLRSEPKHHRHFRTESPLFSNRQQRRWLQSPVTSNLSHERQEGHAWLSNQYR